MHRSTYTRVAAIVTGALAISATLGVGISSADKSDEQATAPKDPTAEVEQYQDRNLWNDTAEWNYVAGANAYEYVAGANYAAALERARAEEAARQAEAASVAAAAPAPVARPRPSAPSRPPSAGTSVGGACGGATNGADRFIGAESGGNPNARNPSGAWGCYQVMPGTWASSCSDLGQHGSASVQAQAACASRLPSSSWAANWRMT